MLAKLKKLFQKTESTTDLVITRQGTPECFDDMPLKVHWELTEDCNYRCSYCFNKNYGYKKNFCTLEEAEAAIRHLALANRPSYQVSLLGGEPTSHPYLPEIISRLAESLGSRLEKISIITNGSFNENVMDSVLSAATTTCIEIKVSMHYEFLKMEKIKYLIESLSNDANLVFLVMLHPGLFDTVSAAVDELCALRKDYPFDISIELIRNPDKNSHIAEQYTGDHYKWMEEAKAKFDEAVHNSTAIGPIIPREAGWEFLVERDDGRKTFIEEGISTDELVNQTGCHFTGMTCCVGTSVVDIKPDGTTKGLVCGLAKDRFNIYAENPFRKDGIIKTVLCTKERCNCNIDWRTPKFLSKSDAEEFIQLCEERQQKLIDESLMA